MNPRPNRIRDLPKEERPRERLMNLGAEALSSAELLAIIIGTGNARTGETALELARKVLCLAEGRERGSSSPGTRFLVRASLEELTAIPGIGLAKGVQLKAALELGRRLARSTATRETVRSPQDAGILLMDSMRYLEQEQFRVVLLNTKNHVIGIEVVSVGGQNASVVHPREVFKEAVRRGASSIILAHNHPSGDPSPSPEDLRVTERLKEAGQLLGIEVLDHLIVGYDRYVSFRAEGIGWDSGG